MCSRYARLIVATLPAIVLAGLTLMLSPHTAAAPAYDCAAATGLPQAECEALVALYNATGGDNWGANTGWLQTTTPCTWHGVTCAADRVQELRLTGDNLTGPIPPEIGNLTSLTELWLGNNQLTNLPPEIGNLVSLTFLTLDYNQLASLPPQLGNLANLEVLDLFSNRLTSLPPEIGSLAGLHELNLGYNQLASLPPEFGNLASLTLLSLSNDQLASLPPEIGNLTSLTDLWVGSNQLASLPPEIGNLASLTRLNLIDNRLANLPPEIGNLANVTRLNVDVNQLTILPPQIGNLASLTSLGVSDNQLASLPPEFGNLANLTRLNLVGNQLTILPPEIGNLASLASLSLGDNQLASLPPEFGNLAGLAYLGLDSNQLASLPPSFGDLRALVWLRLNDNPLSGPLPAFLTGLSSLDWFTFYGTEWCVPSDDPSVPAWLASVDLWSGSGFVCGQPPGAFAGHVTNEHGHPLPGVSVALYRRVPTGLACPGCPLYDYRFLAATTTDTNGDYTFANLGKGALYRLYFADGTGNHASEYYDNARTRGAATGVTATLGITRTGLNAALEAPPPPLATLTTTGGSVNVDPADGSVIVNVVNGRQADVSVSRAVTCTGGVTPSLVELRISALGGGATYTMTAVGDDTYQATVPAADITVDSELWVQATCNGTPTFTLIGEINLYDPTGVIRDVRSGEPVTGAAVTLFQVPGWLPRNGPADTRPNTCESNRSKDPDAPWRQPAPVAQGGIVDPRTMAYPLTLSPALFQQQTDGQGHYGWDLLEGCWYVTVAAEGYRPLTSPVVGAPPSVSDLNLALIPLDFEDMVYLPVVRR